MVRAIYGSGAIVFVLLGFAAAAQASVSLPADLPKLACGDAVEKLLSEWEVASDWRRQVDPGPGGRTYRSPTQKFGVWIELQAQANGSSEAYRISASGVVRVGWNPKNCEPHLTTTNSVKPEPGRMFTDKDLKTLLDSQGRGLIYVWSPGMVYSVRFMKDVEKVAKKHGLKVSMIVDPHLGADRARRILASTGIKREDPRLESVELLARNFATHYPTAIVYAKGKLSERELIGAYSNEEFDELVSADLKKLGAE